MSESSDPNFRDQEQNTLLLDAGDDNVTDTNFLWEDMENYVRQQGIITRIIGHEDIAKGLTNNVDILEQLLDKDVVQVIMNETSCYAQQLKNSRGNIFSKWLRENELQPMTAEEICTVLVLFMLKSAEQKSSLRLYFSQNQLAAIPIFVSVISLDNLKASADFCILATTSQRTHLKDHATIKNTFYHFDIKIENSTP
jgi:hypothetical protein